MELIVHKTTRYFFLVVLMAESVTQLFAQNALVRFKQQLGQSREASTPAISIIFNQPIYSPGDTAYFSLWLVDRQLNSTTGDRVVHINLYNNQGALLQHQKIKARKGRAVNQIVLRENLNSGRYKVVAFTPSMLACNPQEYVGQWLEIESNKRLTPRNWYDELPARAYAEGHDLIDRQTAKIVVSGSAGQEANLMEDDQPISTLVFPMSGVGTYKLLPEFGKRYAVEFPSEKIKIDLPPVSKDGIAIEAKQEALYLSIPERSSYLARPLHWVAVNQDGIFDSRSFFLESENAIPIQVPPINRGYSEYYIVDSDGKIITHRKVMNGWQSNDVLVGIPKTVGQRDSLSVVLALQSNFVTELSGDFAVSVIQQALFDSSQLIARFPITPFSAVNQWLALNPHATRAEINQILAAYSTPFFVADQLSHFVKIADDLSISGRILSNITTSTIPDSTLVLAFLQKNAIGYETFTRSGAFKISSMLDFWGDESIFISLRNRQRNLDAAYRVELQEDTLRFMERWMSQEGSDPSVFGEYALFTRLVNNSYNFFGTKRPTSILTNSPNRLLEEEFLEPDHTVDVEKFVIFPSIEDLIKEAVPFVQIRNRGDGKQVRLAYRTANSTRLFNSSPLLVIDGNLTFDVDYFLKLAPSEISYLKILNNPNKLAQLGKIGEAGVLFVQTKERPGGRAKPKSNYLEVIGLTRSSEFLVSPLAADKKFPDFRSTLFWQGNLRLTSAESATIRFRASDDLGPMVLIVAGFTDDGKFVYKTASFSVERK